MVASRPSLGLSSILFCIICAVSGYRLAPSEKLAHDEAGSGMNVTSKILSIVKVSDALAAETDEKVVTTASFFKKLLVGCAFCVIYLAQPASGQTALMHPLGAMPPQQRALMPDLKTETFQVDLPTPPELDVNLGGLTKEAIERKAADDLSDFLNGIVSTVSSPIADSGRVWQLVQTIGMKILTKDLFPSLEALVSALGDVAKGNPEQLLQALDEYVKKLPDQVGENGASAATRSAALLTPSSIRTPTYNLAFPLIRMLHGTISNPVYRRHLVIRAKQEGPETVKMLREILRTLLKVLKEKAPEVAKEIKKAFEVDPYTDDFYFLPTAWA